MLLSILISCIFGSSAHAFDIEHVDDGAAFYSSPVESNRTLKLPKETEDFLFSEKKGVKTDAMIILKDGQVVYERYARGYTRIMKHPIYSVAKSLSVMMMSIAAKMGYIDLDKPLSEYYPLLKAEHAGLTLRNFMTMTSGLGFFEQEVLKFKKPNVISLLYGSHVDNIGAYMLNLPQTSAPGTTLDYSSGDTNVLWFILKSRMSKEAYNNFPFDYFFNLLDIHDVAFEQDEAGTFLGSTMVYMRPIDLAKIGFLALNHGKYRGKQIIDRDFLDFMKTPSPGKPKDPKHDPYGGGFWLNTDYGNYKSAPVDLLQAHGFDGQSISMYPSKNMVVVRLADDNRLRFNWDKYMEVISNAFDAGGAR